MRHRWRSALCLVTFLSLAAFSQAAVITFAPEPSLTMPGAFLDPLTPDGAARVAALADVKAYVESVIGNPGAVTISLSVFADPGSPTLATGGQFYTGVPPAASGVVFGNTHAALTLGATPPGDHGFIVFNAAKMTYLGADPLSIPAMLTDFRTIVLHELTHALGWASFMKPDDKTSALTDFLKATFPAMYAPLGEVFSMYDTLLVDSMGFPVILPDGTANPGALPIGGAKIASVHAIAANGGELVPTAVVPFLDGDLTHLDGSVDSVMNPTLPDGVIEREWSEIDLGVLRDLGYIIVPEPSSLAMAASAAAACGLLLVRRRRERRAVQPGLRPRKR